MSYTVQIHDTHTGETRSYVDNEPWDEGLEFLWTEGNRGCDCNRGSTFAWAARVDADKQWPCGVERFLVRITDEHGSELVKDDDWPSEPVQ